MQDNFKKRELLSPNTKKEVILALLPELLPEASGYIILQLGCSEMAEDDLQVAQHSNVVLLAVLSLIERGLVIKLVVITEHFIPWVHITLQHNNRLCLDKRFGSSKF